MISLGKYYHFMAKDVEYVEALKVNSVPYSYQLTVCFRSGRKLSIAYTKEEDCKAEHARVIRQIEMEQRREKDEIMSSLSILHMVVNRIDSRQLRIWRQLEKLLKIHVEEVK